MIYNQFIRNGIDLDYTKYLRNSNAICGYVDGNVCTKYAFILLFK